MYDTAYAGIACMAKEVLTQAPDHQWDAELHQLLHPPLDVRDWSALSAALVAPSESPVLQQPDCAIDCEFEAKTEYIDLALFQPVEPLYLTIY